MNDQVQDPARCFPVLPSLDIAESKRFYGEALGFTRVVHQADDHLIVARDEMELHFQLTSDSSLPANSACYIRGGQIVDLYSELCARGIERHSELQVQPWNMAQFWLRDPHGNLLRFGAAPEEI